MNTIPDFLCHYYDANDGPFRNLSDLPEAEAELQLQTIRMAGDRFASQRKDDYLSVRWELERRVRALFIAKGGRPIRQHPHYFVLGECPWLKSWYPQGCELRIPLRIFRAEIVSFTYGDTFPAMRYADGKPTRGRVYTLDELPSLVEEFGLPQAWNADGAGGPDRYIEAQVWEDEPIKPFLPAARGTAKSTQSSSGSILPPQERSQG